MTNKTKLYTYNAEMDEIIRYMTKSEYEIGELKNIEARIDILYNKFNGDTDVEEDKYKLYLAQALVNCRSNKYQSALDWLNAGLDSYGGEYPNYSEVENLVIAEARTLKASKNNYNESPYTGPVLELIKHTGLLLAFQDTTYNYKGNPEVLSEKFYGVQLHNFLFGWWSFLSVFINPLIIIANTIRWLQYKHRYRDWESKQA